jgi:uncharacterized membrane protein YccF (DUF307 family)
MSREKLEKIKCGNYKAAERSLIDAMFCDVFIQTVPFSAACWITASDATYNFNKLTTRKD